MKCDCVPKCAAKDFSQALNWLLCDWWNPDSSQGEMELVGYVSLPHQKGSGLDWTWSPFGPSWWGDQGLGGSIGSLLQMFWSPSGHLWMLWWGAVAHLTRWVGLYIPPLLPYLAYSWLRRTRSLIAPCDYSFLQPMTFRCSWSRGDSQNKEVIIVQNEVPDLIWNMVLDQVGFAWVLLLRNPDTLCNYPVLHHFPPSPDDFDFLLSLKESGAPLVDHVGHSTWTWCWVGAICFDKLLNLSQVWNLIVKCYRFFII